MPAAGDTADQRAGPGREQRLARAIDEAVEGTVQAVRRDWRAVLRRTSARIVRDRLTVAAASLAYHLFLALFPAVIAGLGILTLGRVSSHTEHTLVHGIERALPPGAANVVKAAVDAATKRASATTAAVTVGILVALWSVSSAMAVLQQTLDIAYEVPKDRSFLQRRIRAVPLMAVTAVLGGLAAVLVVFGKPVGSAIAGVLPLGGAEFKTVWTVLRWIVAFLSISLLFSVYYYFGPNRPDTKERRFRLASPGGLFAAAVFLLASLGFSFYVSSFGSYAKIYGSFAGVAILILWFYLTGIAVLVGGELNAEVERDASLGAGGDGAVPSGGSPETPVS